MTVDKPLSGHPLQSLARPAGQLALAGTPRPAWIAAGGARDTGAHHPIDPSRGIA